MIVVIDTSSPTLGVALATESAEWMRAEVMSRGAETKLIPWVVEGAIHLGCSIQALKKVGVVVGPGTFTGLRVGMATAMGLAQAAKCPLVPIGSLEARMRGVSGDVLALLDARKGRFYASARVREVVFDACDISLEEALSWMPSSFMAVGEGSVLCREAIEARGGCVVSNAGAPPLEVLLALTRQADCDQEGVANLSILPNYCRSPDAKAPAARSEQP